MERSKKYEGVQVNFCLNYGGRDEIVRAAQRCRTVRRRKRRPEELTEDMFSDLLYSAGVPDRSLSSARRRDLAFPFPVMAVGLCRILFTDVLWPDFGPEELDKTIDAFNARAIAALEE